MAVKLRDVLEVQNGFAFRTEFFSQADGLPLIRIRDLGSTSTETRYRGEYRAEFLVEPGDLLIGMDGNFTCRRWAGPSALLNQRVCRLRNFSSQILPDYVFYGIQPSLNAIETTTSFSTVKHISARQILDIELPLPPLDAQRRVVDVLSRAEGIVRLRRQAQQKAAELIPAIFVDMFGDPATNSKDWPTSRLRDLVEFQSGGTPSKSRSDYWQGDVPWVSPKDMKRLALYDSIDHISNRVLAETSLKLVPAGSVLIVVRGMILAHTVPVAEARVPLTVNQDMKALIPMRAIRPTYLLWMLQVCHDRLLAQVTTAAHGTKKLDSARLEEMTIPLPPDSMQQAFETHVRRLEGIQEHQVNAAAKAEAAFSALLARAFAAEVAGNAVREAEDVVS
jgi:type I restriction enzyme, S subunit